ncbi:unnamed protein product [Orchesella dallaii]|uniref:Uncharacterized protein n=1 Tax=Orchesella dallaii TaxID=48710 RepID=A0ABP1R3A2_9HEXA
MKKIGKFHVPCSNGAWIILWLVLLMIVIAGSQDMTTMAPAPSPAPGPAPPPVNELLDSSRLKAGFDKLFKYYTDNKGSITHDCKVDSTVAHNDHRHWGTLESLEFLSENRPHEKMSRAEKIMITYMHNMRRFLSRIGYLKDPGSLVFVQKQIVTLKLDGCPDSSIWRKQGGGSSEDTSYQESFVTGGSLKQHTDQPWAYINKYTCFDINKPCTHTFYVITKISPDLPPDLMVREGGKTAAKDFTCGIPYCTLKSCDQSAGSPFKRRAYPPFFIHWDVPAPLKVLLGLKTTDLVPKLGEAPSDLVLTPFGNNAAGVHINWYLKRKASKDDIAFDHHIGNLDPEWTDSFGEKVPIVNRTGSAFASAFALNSADPFKHDGIVECIIIDGNGVVSTPNLEPNERIYDYHGDVNVHILPRWQLWGPVAVSVGCLILVILIIVLCPRKMEHDDGTRYTKDELVVPVTNPTQKASFLNPRKSKRKTEAAGENEEAKKE